MANVKTFRTVLVILSLMASVAGAQSPTSENLALRTNRAGKNIIAVTADGRFFGIQCSYGLPLWSDSSAVLVFPNEHGDVTFKGQDEDVLPYQRSVSIPMNTEAMKKICNRPNGLYVLNINTANGKPIAEYVSGTASSADSGRRDLRY